MAKTTFNIGNSTSGDSLKLVIQKASANFDDLYIAVGINAASISDLSQTLQNTTSALAPLSGAAFTGPVAIAAPLTVRNNNLTLVENVTGGNGDIAFVTAGNVTRWTLGADNTGKFVIWQGAYAAAALTIGTDQQLQIQRSPTCLTAHVDQGGVSNVSWAGADPSGQIDSSPAFQAALNALASLGGGVLHVPAGTFLVTQNLVWNSTTPLTIRGTGAASVIIQQALYCFDISLAQVTISDLLIKCDRQGGSFLRLRSLQYAEVSNLTGYPTTASNYWDAAFDIADVNNSGFRTMMFRNNSLTLDQITDPSLLFGAMFKIRNSGSNIKFESVSALNFHTGFDLQAGTNLSLMRMFFTDCTIRNVMRGIYYVGSSNTNLRPVNWSGGEIYAFEYCIYASKARNVTVNNAYLVRNCAFNSATPHLFLNEVVLAGTINGNILDVAQNSSNKGVGGATGIYLYFCDGITVISNCGTLSDDASGLIKIENSSACTVVYNRARGGKTAVAAATVIGGSGHVVENNRTA